ncbi:aminotransferase class I/II-fold pyridoxal phosphate-dependent enzyme [Candidatus Microgenomates bacterium]|nr:aminotransferase class I/II-fold pyridoxal phosphate-dependent enzyme [Candidatus Microgenomates bacterium]
MKLSSKNIHLAVHESDPVFGSVIPPIYTSSTFIFPTAREGAKRFAGVSHGMIYSRFTNPTVEALEVRLAALEEGEKAIVTSSGMSAISLTLLHLLKTGDTILAHKVLYGCTFSLITNLLTRFGIKVKMIDFRDINSIKNAIDPSVKVIYFESPTNPLLEIIDIKKIAALAKKNKILTVFDNTFAPPPCQYPIRLGMDVVVHSLTKYINGHSDVIGGAVIGSQKLISQMFSKSFIDLGPCISPFNAYLILRGMTTLEIRIKKQSESTEKIARFLEKHPKIQKVYYPKLSSHPQHLLAKQQMAQFGGVLSFEVKGGRSAGEKLVNSVKLIDLAVSLGAVESLIEHPASMTHAKMGKVELEKSGIGESLVRLSIGLEDTDDLIADLKQALAKI